MKNGEKLGELNRPHARVVALVKSTSKEIYAQDGKHDEYEDRKECNVKQ